MDALKGLNSETLVIVGVLWILREVFGFLRSQAKSRTYPEMKSLIRTNEKIAENIEEQTSVLRDLIYEIKSLQKDVARVSDDVLKLAGRRPSVRDRV